MEERRDSEVTPIAVLILIASVVVVVGIAIAAFTFGLSGQSVSKVGQPDSWAVGHENTSDGYAVSFEYRGEVTVSSDSFRVESVGGEVQSVIFPGDEVRMGDSITVRGGSGVDRVRLLYEGSVVSEAILGG